MHYWLITLTETTIKFGSTITEIIPNKLDISWKYSNVFCERLKHTHTRTCTHTHTHIHTQDGRKRQRWWQRKTETRKTQEDIQTDIGRLWQRWRWLKTGRDIETDWQSDRERQWQWKSEAWLEIHPQTDKTHKAPTISHMPNSSLDCGRKLGFNHDMSTYQGEPKTT